MASGGLKNRGLGELNCLLTNKDVQINDIGQGVFNVRFKKQSWELSPGRKRWQEIINAKPSEDLYYGDVAAFIKKNILKDPEIPINHGKVWRQREINEIFTSLLDGLSAKEIAQNLQRRPSAIIYKVGEQLEKNMEMHMYNADCWEKPLLELTVDRSYLHASKKDKLRD